jgi:NAD(P)-dependent dehydrogenase (short-subunit alcohol dehydrogenase family)
MSDQTPRVVVITGASQGIGASLVPAYRKLGYAVLGTSRTIRPPSDDPMIATVQGDIATADTAATSRPRWSSTPTSKSRRPWRRSPRAGWRR